MPLKSCPKCSTMVGPNTHNCRCGHHFPPKEKKGVVSHMASSPTMIIPSAFRADIPIFETYNDEINLDPRGHFNHIIDRESQINRLLRAAHNAVKTNFDLTNHTLLHGESSTGKTTIRRAFVQMVGEENCLKLDATTCTQAGVIGEILERGPGAIKFVLISELDKIRGTGEEFSWMLSAMDVDKEISVMNANRKERMRFKALFIGDCNDLGRVERFRAGALGSRFVNKLYCPPLSDDSIFKAIQPYIKQVGGDDRWIQPAIDFARNELGTFDLRNMIAMVTDGGDEWLTGEYANILRSTLKVT